MLKHLSRGVFTAVVAVGFGLSAITSSSAIFAAQNQTKGVQQVAQGMPPADFGSPPSGQYPILFNDHHVYAKPSTDRKGRVLAALVRGNSILVPLRSMFEQMGATVSYDPASKTVDVSKPGSDIKVTVGQPEVIINGESRPLDVPPMIYHGTVMVPIRVISEGMGAYVQWVPDKRTVVVRYVPPPPPPTAPPAAPPSPPPTAAPAPPSATPAPTPTPTPLRTPYYDHFIVGDYLLSPTVYNEFSPGNKGTQTYSIRGAIELPVFSMPIMIGADWRHWNYVTTAGPVTTITGAGSTVLPSFTATENDIDPRIGIRIANPRIYVAASYLWQNNNYGYPLLRGWGGGVEKLPDLNEPLTFYGSAYYYPSLWGTYAGSIPLQYRLVKYDIGIDWSFLGPSFPVYLDAGFMGNYYSNKVNAPDNISKYGPYVGLGIHF